MYFSTSISYIIILSPLILLALLATIGIVLYRHPSKLQRKWYSVSFKKRKRIKQIAILLGFCMAAGLFIYPLTSKKQFVSTISLSANENNFITEDKIDQISEDRREIKNEKWLKKFYKMMKSDDESSTLLYDSGSYEVWKTSILEDKTGEYELRLRAEDTVLRRFSIQQSDEDTDSDVDFDRYDTDGFYDIIQRPDNTFEENYQKLTDSEKQEIQNLNWNYKDGLLYATNENHKRCINGTSQYYMKNSKLINTMENSGYKGIKKWMEQCEKDTAGIKVKAGDKTYLFHNTDKWHTFKKNGLTCLYNYKRFIIRFDFNKVIGLRSNLSDLPQSGREMWTAISDHSGSAANEVILRSYNDEELYARKNVQIFLQDHKIKQMLIYWDETEAFKGFTKEEKIFLKACFEKMGISSKDAQEWLNTFMIKKTPQSGKLGSWTYSKGNSKNQVISLINNNENNNYVNFYKKSKGNN